MASSFAFPIKELSNDRLLLKPFDPSVDCERYVAGSAYNPELFDYLPYGPFTTIIDCESFIEGRILSDSASFLFTVITKTDFPNLPAGSCAGVFGLLNAQPENAACEIGHALTFPPFQRSHVTTNAVGLLLHYLLDTPSEGGLGLRRVVWQANADNGKSSAAAKRLGFHDEGIVRWQRVLPRGKSGKTVGEREEGQNWGPGRHTAVLSMCWDDWVEGGKRELVDGLMKR